MSEISGPSSHQISSMLAHGGQSDEEQPGDQKSIVAVLMPKICTPTLTHLIGQLDQVMQNVISSMLEPKGLNSFASSDLEKNVGGMFNIDRRLIGQQYSTSLASISEVMGTMNTPEGNMMQGGDHVDMSVPLSPSHTPSYQGSQEQGMGI